jgi:hypothetical protein
MSFKGSIGNIVHRMTRIKFDFITTITGVPPGSPIQDLRVAWDMWAWLTAEVAEELGQWLRWLQRHKGTAIKPVRVRATVAFGSDTGDQGYMKSLDGGTGCRRLARNTLTASQRFGSSSLRELNGGRGAAVWRPS